MGRMSSRLACAVALVFLTGLACGCAKDPNEGRFYWQRDPLARFESVRTYAVERNLEPFFETMSKTAAAGGAADVRRVIEDEIDRQMTSKGFAKAESGRQADVVVRYFGGPERTAVVEQSGGAGSSSSGGRIKGRNPPPTPNRYVPLKPSTSEDRPPERAAGRLVIEVVNPRAGTGMWRGTAEQVIPAGGWDTTGSPQRVREAVAALMKQFPPPK